MKIYSLGLLIVLFLSACSDKDETIIIENNISVIEENSPYYVGKNVYETEEEYMNALYDIDYFTYRKAMLSVCLEKNDFSYFETDILDADHLVGNQLSDSSYMEMIREVIHIKNNTTFSNAAVDDYFSSEYEYFDPNNPKELTENENNILLQIDSILYPHEESISMNEIKEVILGIWQKDTYQIFSGYLNTLRFSETNMAIAMNEMDYQKRFSILEGTYKIINNNIVMNPESYDYINNGKYVFADKDGLIKSYYGESKETVFLSPNGVISYPIISISKVHNTFENKCYYKLILFIDRPTVYYKVREEWN